MTLILPDLSDIEHVPVIALSVEGEAQSDDLTVQQPDGSIRLHAHLAKVIPGRDSTLEILSIGLPVGWQDTKNILSWQVRVSRPGTFSVSIIAAPVHDTAEITPHAIKVSVGDSPDEDHNTEGTLSDTELVTTPRSQYFPEFSTLIGHITVDQPGVHNFTVRAIHIIPDTLDGVTLFGATLQPL